MLGLPPTPAPARTLWWAQQKCAQRIIWSCPNLQQTYDVVVLIQGTSQEHGAIAFLNKQVYTVWLLSFQHYRFYKYSASDLDMYQSMTQWEMLSFVFNILIFTYHIFIYHTLLTQQQQFKYPLQSHFLSSHKSAQILSLLLIYKWGLQCHILYRQKGSGNQHKVFRNRFAYLLHWFSITDSHNNYMKIISWKYIKILGQWKSQLKWYSSLRLSFVVIYNVYQWFNSGSPAKNSIVITIVIND